MNKKEKRSLQTITCNGQPLTWDRIDQSFPQHSMGMRMHLTFLDLSGCCINQLPEEINQLPFLELLDISDNPVASIDNISKLRSLNNITVKNTNINDITRISNRYVTKIKLEHDNAVLPDFEEKDIEKFAMIKLSSGRFPHLKEVEISNKSNKTLKCWTSKQQKVVGAILKEKLKWVEETMRCIAREEGKPQVSIEFVRSP